MVSRATLKPAAPASRRSAAKPGHRNTNMNKQYQIEQDIGRTLLRYCEAVDTSDWKTLADCFTDDCVMHMTMASLNGPETIASFMAGIHDPLDQCLHRLSNISIRIDDDHRMASAKSYVEAILVNRHHPEGPVFRNSGVYHDVLRLEQHWQIAMRRFTPVWSEGNASMALPDSNGTVR